jgi:hypothetical protein
MTTWIVKSELQDLARGRQLVVELQQAGYNAWIEDDTGINVDEVNETTKKAKRIPYETGMVVLIWGTAAVIGAGLLYGCSFLAGD